MNLKHFLGIGVLLNFIQKYIFIIYFNLQSYIVASMSLHNNKKYKILSTGVYVVLERSPKATLGVARISVEVNQCVQLVMSHGETTSSSLSYVHHVQTLKEPRHGQSAAVGLVKVLNMIVIKSLAQHYIRRAHFYR